MKINRFALVAGVLALGVAACGDDVQVVEPTPPQPPLPPAVTASMAPASASVLIGNSVVFAVNASGGVAGDAASWTCASSNSGIATVSVVSAGCQATGVAAGSVTITATVTKSGETVNVGAQLTVTEEAAGEPAFIILKGVTGEGETDASGLKGRVDVNLAVERGDQTLERLSVLVDGEVAAYQSFGSPAMAAPEDDAAAEQAVYDFTLSFDSDGYDLHGDHLHVDYMNGEHSISAELQIAGGMMADGMMGHETISSNVMTVEFDNDDGFIVTADLGHNSALGDGGKRWYGGPTNGHIVISALAVSYSGAEIGEVAVGLEGCDAEEAEGDDHGNGGDDPHAAADISFEFDCEGEDADRAITVSSAGETLTILNADDLPEANIDMEGPDSAPIIVANRNGREEGWINAAVGIAGEYHDKNAKDNWLVEGGEGDTGVGGYHMAVRIGADLEKALEASASSSVPAESDDNDAYCAVAVATDDLGNLAGLPDADDDCREAPAGEDVMVTLIDTVDNDTTVAYGFDITPADSTDAKSVSFSEQTLMFGVDTTAPTVEFADADSLRFNSDIGDIALEPEDDESDVGNSGLADDDGLQVRVQRRDASKTAYLTVAADGSISNTAQTDDGDDYTSITDEDVDFTDPADAYYTVTAMAQDKAGNSSDVIGYTLVYDDGDPTATAPAVPGVIEAGKAFDGAAYLNDGLSIRDYYGHASYGVNFNLGIGVPIEVDAFNAASLTYLNHPVTATVGIHTTGGVLPPYAALQTATGATPTAMSGVSVFVRDQTNDYQSADEKLSPTGAPDKDSEDDIFATGAFNVAWKGLGGDAGDDYDVCALSGGCGDETGTTEDEEDFPTSLKVEIEYQNTASGTFSNPLERVDFWVTDVNGTSWYVGSDTSGTSGRVGGTGDDARYRMWSYSVTLSGELINMATRSDTGGTGTPMIVAIGVNDENVGLSQSTNVDISTEKP